MSKFKNVEKELRRNKLFFTDRKVHKRIKRFAKDMNLKDLTKSILLEYRNNYDNNGNYIEDKLTNARTGETSNQSSRSAGDLFSLAITYNPLISFEAFRKVLRELLEEKFVNSYNCPDIKKRIFYVPEDGYEGKFGNAYDYDEYNQLWELKDYKTSGYQANNTIHPDDQFNIFKGDKICDSCGESKILFDFSASKVYNDEKISIFDRLESINSEDFLRHKIATNLLHDELIKNNDHRCKDCYITQEFGHDVDICVSCGLPERICKCKQVDKIFKNYKIK